MKWLWFVGPLVVFFVGFVVHLWPTHEQARIRRELEAWIDQMLGPLLIGGKEKSRRVRRVPPQFARMLDECGAGERLTDLVLVPKQAYVAARLADLASSVDHVTVLCRLETAGPTFTVRPLPIVDGRPAENQGIIFSKDPEFSDAFVVEGDEPKRIRAWLDAATRRELMELQECWLRVDGKSMAVSYYGYATMDVLDELVGVADGIFADKGAGGGASLFGDAAKTRDSKTADKKSDAPEKNKEPELATAAVRLQAGLIDFSLYAIAVAAVAAMVGVFGAAFHPHVLFNSPDLVVTEAWQGGWTTKGFGAFVAAETMLALLFVYQAYLGANGGQSIGKKLLGARVVGIDGNSVGFMRGVVLRSWIFGLVPLAVAAFMAKKSGVLSARSFFEAVPRKETFYVAAGVVVLLCVALLANKTKRGVHDMVSRTKVVVVPRFRLPAVQLGLEHGDPVVGKRIGIGLIVLVGFVVINAVAFMANIGFWIY